jgi:hypothetical protein
MKTQHKVCKKIRCGHLKEEKCSFHDCIFTTSEIITKEADIGNEKFAVTLIKFAGIMAIILIAGLYLISEVYK